MIKKQEAIEIDINVYYEQVESVMAVAYKLKQKKIELMNPGNTTSP